MEPFTGYRIAADIGGTFTDLAMMAPDGRLSALKVLSTPADYALGIVEGCRDLLKREGVAVGQVEEILHASTVATNAILELKGARTALVTTAGFRDVLELRRIRVPRLYEPLYEKPAPLVERRFRFEADERMAADGAVVRPLDEGSVEGIADAIAAQGIEAVAVCFLHSYANPDHERRAGEILRRRLPGVFLTLSVDVLPEIREYERTSTTVINAYIGPAVGTYLVSLGAKLLDVGLAAPLRMMQSSGGVSEIRSIIAKPALVVESGPAAGVIGAARVGAQAGYEDIITLDMGGTTAKAALIEGGRMIATDEYEVGGGISLSSRLVKGGGYALRLPVIDVSEVGAGGGSTVWRDPTGFVKVGPRSAGSMPGPACYGRGGLVPTVTDANVVLGFLNPVAIAGGAVPIDADAARAAIATVAEGRELHEIAYGVVQIASATMMRAVKAVSTYRGRDPRDFTLFAFGGGGGLYAAELARSLGMREVVVPAGAGVFSAVGLLLADAEIAASRGFLRPLASGWQADAMAILADLASTAVAQLGHEGDADTTRRADVRYAGQAFELGIDLPDGQLRSDVARTLAERFDAEHHATYGHRLDPAHPKEIVALRVVARHRRRGAVQPRLALDAGAVGEPEGRRMVYFGPAGLCGTAIVGRRHLSAVARPGPLVVEEAEGTTVVPPGCAVRLDEHSNIVIAVG